MRRNQIRFVVILGAFAIIGIIVVQTYWLQKTWNIREKQFNQTIFIGLRSVAEKMSQYNQSVLPDENPVSQISSSYFVVNVNSVIDANVLEYFLKTEFDIHNIALDYEYAIYDCHNDKMVYGNYVPVEGKQQPLKLTTNLPKYSEYVYYFGVNFPSKSSYLFGDMSLWIVFSVILLVSVVFFGVSIFVILQQKRLSEMQKDFINNMTHEFKTPISSINISADVITNPEIINNPQRLLNYGAIIKQENNRLNKQVEKVLQIARIEKSGFELKIEEIDLNNLASQVIGNCQANNEQKSCVIKADFDAKTGTVFADKLHLTNILHNLLDNAVKYSGADSHITIKTQRNHQKVCLEVADNGPGISKDYHKKIFQKFFRVPTGNIHDVKGFGLGLYYVKNICQAHKWPLRLESEPGRGTKFIIEIPV